MQNHSVEIGEIRQKSAKFGEIILHHAKLFRRKILAELAKNCKIGKIRQKSAKIGKIRHKSANFGEHRQNSAKSANYSVPEVFVARFRIYAKNAAECDGFRRQQTSRSQVVSVCRSRAFWTSLSCRHLGFPYLWSDCLCMEGAPCIHMALSKFP